jgi:2-octaprenyl-6-methoxyphenol hydroxylase
VADDTDLSFDVAIVGASFAGLALAVSLAKIGKGQIRVAVVERGTGNTKQTVRRDERAFALSAATQHLLSAIGAWTALADQAQPVRKIEITDSALEAGVRPTRLTYDNQLANGEAATTIVPATALQSSLQDVAQSAAGVRFVREADVAALDRSGSQAKLSLADQRSVTASLVVAADGGKSTVRSLAGLQVVGWDYDQCGIVTTIAHSKPHHDTAIQHFLPGGPFAILPRVGNRSCITWSERKDVAKHIMALPEADFLDEVERRVGGKLGTVTLEGERQSWPLSMHLARSYIGARIVLVGDAAHGVHPIAGQGLNLGFRDVAALVDVLQDAMRIGLDIGAVDVLERYQRWRRYDSAVSAATFDGLNRLFSKDWGLLRSAREFGLNSVDRIDAVKRFFVHEAAGQNGEVPSLMQGRAA